MGLPLVIIGAGGHGREVLDIVEAVAAAGHREHEFVGFAADTAPDEELLRRRNADHLGPVAWVLDNDVAYVIGIGDGAARRRVADLCDAAGRRAATLVHPLASVGSDVEMADGCVLAAGARVTTNVRLGRHCHLNVNSSVSHDCRLDDFVTISPGAVLCGTVSVGAGVYVGANACILPGVTIGEGTMIGAGACVTRDVGAERTVGGVPARDLRRPG